MAYRIDFDSPLQDEVRRIASELLTDAVDLLEKQPKGPHEAIHDARRDIKRTRALYRLIASGQPDFAAAENGRLRDIARALSHLRDSAALAETTDYLESETEEKQDKAAIRRLSHAMKQRRDRMASEEDELAETLAKATAGLCEAGKTVRHLRLPSAQKQAIECLSAGWRKTGRKGAHALACCQPSDEDEPFHELRKRAQDRYMHAALLRAAWPTGMLSIQIQSKALVDLLGHEHDLAMLTAHVQQDTDTKAEDKAQFLASIAAERRKLQRGARETGATVFDERSKRDARILALLIRNRG